MQNAPFGNLRSLPKTNWKKLDLKTQKNSFGSMSPKGEFFKWGHLTSKPYISVVGRVGMDKQDIKSKNDKVIELQEQMQLTLKDMTKVMNDLFLIKNKLGRLDWIYSY